MQKIRRLHLYLGCFFAPLLIFFIAILDELILVIRRQKPAYQVAEEDRRARGDYSEMA